MILSLKHSLSIYKRFEKDMWGVFHSLRFLKSSLYKFFYKIWWKSQQFILHSKKRFIYRIDLMEPSFRSKKFKYSFVSLRLVKLYYLVLSYKQFSKMAMKAKKKDVCLNVIMVYC